MSKLLTGSINLSKIDKTKLFTGKKGDKYLNIGVWINDEKDQFGNDAGILQQTKKGEDKIYIGNLKFYEKQNEDVVNNATSEPIEAPEITPDEILPF